MEFEITSSGISDKLTSFFCEEHPLRVIMFYIWGEDPFPEVFDYRVGEIDSALNKLHELSLSYFVSYVGLLSDGIYGVYGVILNFKKSEDGETNVDCGVFEAVCNALNTFDRKQGSSA